MYIDEPALKRNHSEQPNAWSCSNCTFMNSPLLTTCQLCGQDNSNDSFQLCPFCGSQNKLDSNNCKICQKSFVENQYNEEKEEKQKEKYIIYCPNCLFENHKDNFLCLGCETSLKEEINPEKKDLEICPICAITLKNIDAAKDHIKACQESRSMIELLQQEDKFEKHEEPLIIKSIKPLPPKSMPTKPKPVKILYRPSSKPDVYLPKIGTTKICIICSIPIQLNQYQSHVSGCQYQPVDLSTIVKSAPTLMALTPLQKQAVSFMHSSSKVKHDKARPALLNRITKQLGYKSNDLEALEHYVQNYAPIIVHIHVSKHMEFFVKDTHYRNQFQTGKSSGSLSRDSRTQWEDRMFTNKYSAAKDFERVKYGTINFTNDPAGVSACRSYGNSYFLLKSDVRERCTFTDQDSSSATSLIGTFKYGDHVLSKLTDAELKACINAAKANQVSSSVVTTYKQIQIHGPIQFARDIQRLYVNKNQLTNPKFKNLVEEFSVKFGVDYQIF